MNSKVDKLDVGKLETTPGDLTKLSNIVENNTVEKAEYNELVKKVNAIVTSKFVSETDYNAKIKDIKDEIPSITSLATTGVLTVV